MEQNRQPQNKSYFLSLGFHMSKPDMIRKLEEGEELWTTERIFPSQSYLGESVQIKTS